jgi:DNA-binding NarL/FixJ family response regulator
MSIKILLADDSEVIRRAIRSLLNEQPEIELVGEATSFAQTVQMAHDLEPQVILLDLHMKDKVAFKPEVLKSQPNQGTRIVAVSLSNDAEAKELADSFGAVTLLDKAELVENLIPTIRQFI